MTEGQKELTALIIDDEESIKKLFTIFLNIKGIKGIDSVATTAEGLELLTKKNYDFVFTDLNQNPSGIEVYKSATGKGAEAYIMTGYAPDLEEAQQVAGNHLLIKPFDIEEVVDKIIKDYINKQST